MADLIAVIAERREQVLFNTAVENVELVHEYFIIIIIISSSSSSSSIIKKVGSARLRESDVHPISPKAPAPQYQPIDRKMRRERE